MGLFRIMSRSLRHSILLLAFCVSYFSSAATVFPHLVPFSYVDLRIQEDGVHGTVIVHATDLAHDLHLDPAELLRNPALAQSKRSEIVNLVSPRLALSVGHEALALEAGDLEVLAERQALALRMRFPWTGVPGVFSIRCLLFPYDPGHQTFLNVYEGKDLAHQEIFDRAHFTLNYYTGTAQGAAAVVRQFIPAGVRHILVGPDHILFIIGLLLLGGSLSRLVKIVTAFTIAHSVTLSLAALDLLNPPARIIEPAIALSIVYVGADNLIAAREGRDVRVWIAFFFGFVHGFGFANVLKEFGLPRHVLAWSLFSFNFGVEIGQIVIVVAAGSLLAAVRSRSKALAQRIVLAGSAAVILAGAYWFVERVFFNV